MGFPLLMVTRKRGFLTGPLRADLLSQAVREQVDARPWEWRKAG